jgi:hypothetical protein
MKQLILAMILAVTAITAQAQVEENQSKESSGLWSWIKDHSCGGKWSCSDEKPVLTASEAVAIVTGLAIIANGLNGVGAPNYQGPCLFETDRAKDGSLCGGRAATVRPGGKY